MPSSLYPRISSSGRESWFGSASTPQQILNPAAHDVAFAVPLQPLPAFFERFLNGFGERLAGFAGHLAGQSFGGFVLDAQGHGY